MTSTAISPSARLERVSATRLRRSTREVVESAIERPVLVTHRGAPAGVLMDYELWTRLENAIDPYVVTTER